MPQAKLYRRYCLLHPHTRQIERSSRLNQSIHKPNKPKADLHSHSCASDGQLTPTELVMRAANRQVDMLALTDHDTLSGLAEAHAAAAASQPAVRIINGVEISCSWHGQEIHVVGLNFDAQHPAISQLMEEQNARRLDRAKRIAAAIERLGVEDVMQKVQGIANGETLTRPHFARLLIKEGLVSNLDTAFKKYLRKGKRAYVTPHWCSIADAVEAIQASAGVAVLAHPYEYRLSHKWTEKLIAEFAECGGRGLEVAQCRQTPNQRKRLAELANQHQLLASMGSDFHYPDGWNDLGKGLHLPENVTPVWQLWHESTE